MTSERKILAEALRVQADEHEVSAIEWRESIPSLGRQCETYAVRCDAKARNLRRAAELLVEDAEREERA